MHFHLAAELYFEKFDTMLNGFPNLAYISTALVSFSHWKHFACIHLPHVGRFQQVLQQH